MKIGIIGGTGAFGKGLALRWGARHRILIGSRDAKKAETVANECRTSLGSMNRDTDIAGYSNASVARQAEIIVLSVKFENLDPIIESCRHDLKSKIVLSPVAALEKKRFFQCVTLDHGSAAAYLQDNLPDSTIIAALHTIPAHRLRHWDEEISGDVPVCGDDAQAKKTIMDLVIEIKNLKPVDAGPLRAAGLVEPIVPLLLNLKLFGGLKSTSVQFV
jgi:NADPH-dependent F420 reductase